MTSSLTESLNFPKTVKLALFKAPGDWMDKVIRLKTNSIYSHCELVVNDCDWYTSHISHGGVIKVINSDYDPAKWDFVKLPWLDGQDVEDFYEKTKAHHYNLAGVVGIAFGIPISSHEKWHCAQWCSTVLGLEKPVLQSPQTVYLNALKILDNYQNGAAINPVFEAEIDTVKNRTFRGKFV